MQASQPQFSCQKGATYAFLCHNQDGNGHFFHQPQFQSLKIYYLHNVCWYKLLNWKAEVFGIFLCALIVPLMGITHYFVWVLLGEKIVVRLIPLTFVLAWEYWWFCKINENWIITVVVENEDVKCCGWKLNLMEFMFNFFINIFIFLLLILLY